jgi:co-chaperonin GroES (HSP10)
MKLRPLKTTVLFSFLDETAGSKGQFTERTKGTIIIPALRSAQDKTPRWARVTAVGPDVDGVVEGDFILIEPLQWTRHEVFEGEKVWKTDDSKILAVTNDEASTYGF